MLVKECLADTSSFLRFSLTAALLVITVACGHSSQKFLARGEEYLAKRKFYDAMMQFRSAVEMDKDSSQAHWGLARSYESLGQFNETIDELRKTVELDSSNLDAKARLGNYFLLVQPPMIAEAEKVQEDIIARDPKFIEAVILRASILAAQNRPENEVIAKINEAISIDPSRSESYLSLSRYYMSHDMTAEAEQSIKRGIAVNPNSSVGLIAYGRFLFYAGRYSESETQFQNAISLESTSIEAFEAIADFYASTRQIDKAEASYKALVNLQDNSPESRLELADFYNTALRRDEAIATLEQIIVDHPDYVRARYRLGQVYLDLRQADKVDKQLTELLKINDDDSEALMLRARLRMLQSRAPEAVKDLENVLKKQPSQRDALFYMAQAKLVLGEIDQAKAFIGDLERYHPSYLRTGLLKIQAANAVGETAEALKQANLLVAETGSASPNAEINLQGLRDLQLRAMTARGLASLDLGKTADAKTDLEAVVSSSPNSSAAVVNLGKVFMAEDNVARSLGLFEKALSMDATNFDALNGFVNVSVRAGQYGQAHAKVDEMLSKNLSRSDVLAALHYLKSTIFLAENDRVSEEAELRTAIECDDNYLPAYSSYASLLAGNNEIGAAIEKYQKIVEISPSSSAYTMLGILEDARGRTPESEWNYRRALELTPDSPISANNLAWLIVETRGNLDEALQLASLAVSRNPDVAGFYDTLGYVYMKKGLYAPAVEQFRRAVTLDETKGQNSNPGFRVRLGSALANVGDKVAARREVEASLRFQTLLSQKEISDAKNVLSSL